MIHDGTDARPEVRDTGLHANLITGADALERLGRPLDALLEDTAAPVTARRTWLATWVRCYPEYSPLAFSVTSGDGRLEAVALLARRARLGFDDFVALGHGPSDLARLPARSTEAAVVLAATIVAHLRNRDRRWRLLVRQLPRDDAVAQRIARALAGAELASGDVSPAVQFGPDRTPRSYVSANHHRDTRRMANRIFREVSAPVIEHLRGEEEIRTTLPEVEEVSVRRDVSVRGRSNLDRGSHRRFFREVILDHAARDEIELTTLRIGGVLVAYTLCFLDRGMYRVWSCKISPDWVRYGLGRLANDAALRHALGDPASIGLDWMRGDEPYKYSMCNHVERAQDLLAWSSPSVKTILHARRRVRDRLRELAAKHREFQEVLQSTRRLQSAGRRLWRVLAGRFGHGTR
jgi:CelD/BcsL family acetyltransferase involved in cellulose biosynthesis